MLSKDRFVRRVRACFVPKYYLQGDLETVIKVLIYKEKVYILKHIKYVLLFVFLKYGHSIYSIYKGLLCKSSVQIYRNKEKVYI